MHWDAGQERNIGGVGATIHKHIDIPGQHGTVGCHRGTDPNNRIIPALAGQEIFLSIVGQPDGATDLSSEQGSVGLKPGIEFCAKAAADVVADHSDVRRAQTEGSRHPIPDVVGKLMCNVDSEPLAVELGHGHPGLHVGLVLAACLEAIFNHVGRPFERLDDTVGISDALCDDIA
jgi:hypothetical protein